jgi:outer membrane protein assembly factor BamB
MKAKNFMTLPFAYTGLPLLLPIFVAMTLWGVATGQCAPLAEQNWPQWRGPLQNGVAPQGNPPVEWSETKNVKWKVKIPGKGSATPIVWEDKVFVLSAIPTGKKIEPPPAAAADPGPRTEAASQGGADEPRPPRNRGGFGGGQKPTEVYQFVILCLDRQTGQTLWQQTAREEVPHEGHHRSDGTFASSSPVTDGKNVFAYFGSRGLHSYDMNGKLQWSQEFGQMRIAMGFGEGSSPALYKDTLIINWDHEGDDFIAALDKKTGRTLWKETREERTSWSTPLVVEHDNKAQVITTASAKVRSYDLATGQLVWECAKLTGNVIPSPVAGDGMIFAMSGFRGNALLAIRLGRTGDLTDTDAVAWRHDRSTPYVPSPLLYGDKLYFFKGNEELLSCLEARAGKLLLDAERVEGLKGVYASPVAAGGRVYLVGRNGGTVVIKSSDKFEKLATNQLDEKFDASPAVVGKDLFLRGHEYLYCLAEK